MSLQLLVFWGEELHTYDLPDTGEVTLGRAESNHFRIDHPTVSRRHARLRRQGSSVRLEDLGAANGTFVRDLGRAESAGQTQIETLRRLVRESVELGIGQSIQLGSVSAVLRRVRTDVSASADTDGDGSAGSLPLRERPADLDALIQAFLDTARRQLERRPLGISEPARALLRAYAWPGNVRELRHAIERAVVLCTTSTIEPEHLPASVTKLGADAAHAELHPERFQAQMDALERERILAALNRCDGNQTRAAQLLGVSRRTLVSRLGALGLPRPRKRLPGSGRDPG